MFELIYYSAARPGLSEADILAILNTSRSFNAKNNITGCLLYYGDEFLQILEGEENVVRELFSRIELDKRHFNVQLLETASKDSKSFSNWSMAFHKLNENDAKKIGESLFIDNFITFAELSEKPTYAIQLFWYMARQMLKSQRIPHT